MKRAQRKEVMRTGAYDIHIIGAPTPGLRDAYHALLRLPWWGILLTITGSFLALNALFALQTAMDMTYLWGGVALPDRMTYASYAHRGAYPLIVTALLAGACAPPSSTRPSRSDTVRIVCAATAGSWVTTTNVLA